MSRYSKVSHEPPKPVRRAVTRFARNLRRARQRRGWSQMQVAEKIGVSRSLVVKMEKGSPSTTVGAYASALDLFGMLDELAGLADPERDRHDGLIDLEQTPQPVDPRTPGRLRRR